jgi:hypothetical protein
MLSGTKKSCSHEQRSLGSRATRACHTFGRGHLAHLLRGGCGLRESLAELLLFILGCLAHLLRGGCGLLQQSC